VALLFLGVVGMPSLAELLLPLMPASVEQTFGDTINQYKRAAFKGPGPFACGVNEGETEGQAAFLKLMGKLEMAAALPVKLHPVVVRDLYTINAFATAGGYVYLLYGLIDFAENPEELAAVLAHELGHVAHRDSMRSFLHEAGLSFIVSAVLGDVFGTSVFALSPVNEVLSARHTRTEEAAADHYATELLRKMGQDPHAVAIYFEQMLRRGSLGSTALLADHPTNQERLDAILATPPAEVTSGPVLTPEEWTALKQICAVPRGTGDVGGQGPARK